MGVTVGMWCCPTYTGSEVSSCVGGVGVERLQSLCVHFGPVDAVCMVLVGLFVGFRWPVNIRLRIGVFEAQDGAALGVTWLFPPVH